MSTRDRVALGVVGFFAAVALVACTGQAPLAPSGTSSGMVGNSTSSAQGVMAAASHDLNDDHGQDAAGHDANDDHGQDAPGHDANDDRGQDSPDDDAQHDAGELTGPIAGLKGQCPDLTFSIAAVTVTTSGATRFRDVACRSLTNGMAIEVKGSRTGATLAASDVQRR